MAITKEEQYINTMPYNNIKYVFLNKIDHKKIFAELFENYEEKAHDSLAKFMTQWLAKHYDKAELDKMFHE